MKKEKTVDIAGFFKSLWVANPEQEYNEDEINKIDVDEETRKEFEKALKNINGLEALIKTANAKTTKKKEAKSPENKKTIIAKEQNHQHVNYEERDR
jgi:hypothetical protein